MRWPHPRHFARVRISIALALLSLSVACHGQNGGGIHMGQGLVLRAAAPRQLMLNAHVTQFACQPGGDSIAYVSVRDDDVRTVTIKFVGTRQNEPDTRALYSVTGDAPNALVTVPQVPTPEPVMDFAYLGVVLPVRIFSPVSPRLASPMSTL